MRLFERRVFAAASIACFAAAYALTPSEVRSHVATVALATQSPVPADPAEVAVVAPVGDPFAPRVVDDEEVPASARVTLEPRIGPAHLEPLPPNAGALMGLPLSPMPRVTAIVVGAHPSALISEGSASHIFTLGSSFDGTAVTSIDADSVRLRDGRRFVLLKDDHR